MTKCFYTNCPNQVVRPDLQEGPEWGMVCRVHQEQFNQHNPEYVLPVTEPKYENQ